MFTNHSRYGDRMHLVVAYDIVDNRIRARVAKTMVFYLTRVQKSVFEGDLTYDRYLEMKDKLNTMIDHNRDSVRIYHICANCDQLTEVMGQAVYVPDTDEDEVI